jgi:hypothetical protein
VLALALAVAGCSSFFPGGASGSLPAATPTGCSGAAEKHVAPGGYYVNGNSVCTADGQLHLFHGVARPSMEWSAQGEMLSAADFMAMASWKANVVRIALNQDFWLSQSPLHSAGYPALVDNAVQWAEAAGMDVILDLHWSDRGTLGSCTTMCQQLMADANSITFWSEVATRYKNDGRVMFELYNEPHDVSWPIWKSGGMTSQGWMAAGMQQLYDAIRMAGADNLVIVGGLTFAYDLSGVPYSRITGYNIMYATHPYNNGASKGMGSWDSSWGFLTKTDPVIVTEFGDATAGCPSMYSSEVIAYSDLHAASWTAWAWYPGGCTFPAIINDWRWTPTNTGMVVKAALAGYDDPAPGGKQGGGTGGASGAGGAGGASGTGGSGGAGGGAQPGTGGAGGAETGGDDAGTSAGDASGAD